MMQALHKLSAKCSSLQQVLKYGSSRQQEANAALKLITTASCEARVLQTLSPHLNRAHPSPQPQAPAAVQGHTVLQTLSPHLDITRPSSPKHLLLCRHNSVANPKPYTLISTGQAPQIPMPHLQAAAAVQNGTEARIKRLEVLHVHCAVFVETQGEQVKQEDPIKGGHLQ
eukprot:210390-Pelagomonas_calceolata.AAC.12